MNVLVLGSGGREHAIITSFSKSKLVNKIFALPGNGGTSVLATNIDGDINDFEKIKSEVISNDICIVFVGPEDPIVNGIYDFFKSDNYLKNIKIIAPSMYAGQLEGSKEFAKNFMKRHNIPTAKHGTFTQENIDQAYIFLDSMTPPYVLKADGLAAGKGVIIAETKEHAVNSVKEIFSGKFGSAGDEIVIEEFLEGEEASFFVISDGNSFIPLTSAQDHKRIGDGDTGLNTGGMGAYSPAPIINKDLEEKTINKIIKPTLKALNDYGESYVGILYAGLMIKDGEPKLIEYNVRFGDPECQVIIPRLENDLVDLLVNVKEKNLDNYTLNWKDNYAITVVLAANGYPENYQTGDEIKGLDQLANMKNVEIFHAGTKMEENKVVTSGGRVLNVNGYGKKISEAKENAYDLVKKINWPNCYYRRDIGWRVLKD